MATTDRVAELEEVPEEPTHPDVTTHETSPDRVVFTESGNSDGWISTDLAVELER